jgi:two-component system, LytTR family, response regulator LytT
MKFNYLIVDDEPLARKLIASHAAKIDVLERVGECSNAIEASGLLRTRQVDLIFLDIQMPEITGLQLAHTLKNPPAIILTTAFRDFAPEAFDLEVVDYLLKPISFDRLLRSVNKFFDQVTLKSNAVQAIQTEQEFLYVKAERKVHKVYLNEILYIESLDDYVKLHLKSRLLVTRENISALEKKLPSPHFVRIHRSFIVNAKGIIALSNDGLEIAGKELPFGRAFKKSALGLLSVTLK